MKYGKYECYLKPDTRLPMIYIDDCLRAIIEFMTCKEIDLKSRTYNISAISFTPKELENALQKYIPDFIMTYRPDWRQDIGKLKF
jgi:threonine dehydrogenase